MDMTSHLLAALSLPPIRDVPPYTPGNDQQPRDRPLPLEPSASQDAYSSSQYQQGRREPSTTSTQQPATPGQAETGNDSQSRDTPRSEAHDGNEETVVVRPNTTNGGSTMDRAAAGEAPTTRESTSYPGTRPYPAILPSGSTPNAKEKPNRQSPMATKTPTNRRQRRKWTEEETNDLIKGCHIHGVGNWKKVLDDPRFHFNERSSVDLKDRFRTCFPKEYRKASARGSEEGSDVEAVNAPPGDTIVVTPNQRKSSRSEEGEKSNKKRATKTELHHAEVLNKLGIEGQFKKVQRRERREFTAEEDAKLLQGFTIYGAQWTKIQTDQALQLNHRRSTDLRDRFRNAFPDKYESAGFKARPRQRPKPSRSPTSSQSQKKSGGGEEAGEEGEEDGETRGGPSIEGPNKDHTTFLMQSLLAGNLSPNWGHQEGGVAHSDQSPAPGSLALDPALSEGFEGNALEQITDDFLSAAQGPNKEVPRGNENQTQNDIVRWEDMAHPIFELEPSMTSTSQQADIAKRENAGPGGAVRESGALIGKLSKKRAVEATTPENTEQKKRRAKMTTETQQQTAMA